MHYCSNCTQPAELRDCSYTRRAACEVASVHETSFLQSYRDFPS